MRQMDRDREATDETEFKKKFLMMTWTASVRRPCCALSWSKSPSKVRLKVVSLLSTSRGAALLVGGRSYYLCQ